MATALKQQKTVTAGQAVSQPRGQAFGQQAKKLVFTWGIGLAVFCTCCGGLRLWGHVRLATANSNLKTVQRSVNETERGNVRLSGVITGRLQPGRMTFAGEHSGMMPVSPDSAISWPRNSRTIRSAATPSDLRPSWP